jgi:hypothetical protein
MTRDDYLRFRNKNAPDMVYEFYKKHFDQNKHKPFLQIQEFFQVFQMWPSANEAYKIVTDYYDAEFNILKVPNKEGQYFMYI